MSDLTDQIRHDVATLDLVREHLAGRHEQAHEACLACQLVEARAELERLCAQRDNLLALCDNSDFTELRIDPGQIRNHEGTVIGCRSLALPV